MPLIALKEPFIRHYAGSVFFLPQPIFSSKWDEDAGITDRMNYSGEMIYSLPDNGKGIYSELPVKYPLDCPMEIFTNTDIKSGPCRITSVSNDLADTPDPFYADPMPKGMGKILYDENSPIPKNVITLNLAQNVKPDKVKIFNSVNLCTMELEIKGTDKYVMDFSTYDPGFYSVSFFLFEKLIYSFTLIKCYPLVVLQDKANKLITTPTIW